jgi:hypothetical protein
VSLFLRGAVAVLVVVAGYRLPDDLAGSGVCSAPSWAQATSIDEDADAGMALF